ncbi:MAG: efflux RND transporter periplasmic adaptor subunit [Candidatus Competibacterales bacterium]
MAPTPSPSSTPAAAPGAGHRPRRWSALWPVVVLLLGVGAAGYLLTSSPKAQRQPPVRRPPLVEVMPVALATHPTVVEVLGTVRAATQIDLQPRVSGEIRRVHPALEPGGLLKQGDVAVKIDPLDFEIKLRQHQSEVDQVRADLHLEEANRIVAEGDYRRLEGNLANAREDLILRKPQLEAIRARLRGAEAALEQAKTDLARTAIQAPFDAVVVDRAVDRGAQVTPSTTLATLVGTDQFWLEVTVPLEDLTWIDLPSPRDSGAVGSPVRVYADDPWGQGVHRTGRVLRRAAALTDDSRMAVLYIAIDDPLSLDPEGEGLPPLLLGTFVRAEIQGRPVANAVALDRALLRDGDRVWLLTPDDTLAIRPVTVAHRGLERVLITRGLNPGERVIRSDLPVAVAGMALRVAEGQEDQYAAR